MEAPAQRSPLRLAIGATQGNGGSAPRTCTAPVRAHTLQHESGHPRRGCHTPLGVTYGGPSGGKPPRLGPFRPVFHNPPNGVKSRRS